MHFIREACNKRLLESRALTYSRGVTAIFMGCLFVAYCIYLTLQMYNNQPLLQISSEAVPDISATPDVELCVQNSTLTVVKCAGMYYNWSMVDIPNCGDNFFRHGENDNNASKCYVFESNGTFHMSRGLTYDDRNAFRRMDFYWNIDAISVPAISIQFFSPQFSSWKADTVGTTTIEANTMKNLLLGGLSETSSVNYSTNIFYHPQKYRAIRPNDVSTLLGFRSNFIDIVTLKTKALTWPLQQNPSTFAFDRKLYQGVFSFELGQDTSEVKTEVMQYTLISSIALAGGCYSVLTTIYVVLFGMSKLSPWGIAHRFPTYIGKGQLDQANPYTNSPIEDDGAEGEKNMKVHSSIYGLGSLFSRHKVKSSDHEIIAARDDLHNEKPKIDSYSTEVQNTHMLTVSLLPPRYHRVGENSTSFPVDQKAQCQEENDELNKLKKETAVLHNRMEEMEFMLSEYFINTKYLDQLRHRRKTLVDDTELMFG